MNPETEQKVRAIKQSLRLMMDGCVAQSMRDKGVNYQLNWGATLTRLREKAKETGYDYNLAIALWKENIRECKILATMIMPPEKMLPQVVDIWMEQTPTIEIAEQATMNLYQHLDCASVKAYEWIASDKELYQLSGFHVLSRLFMRGLEPNERGINEFLDQAHTALLSASLPVRKAALNSLSHFAELGIVYRRLADNILRQL